MIETPRFEMNEIEARTAIDRSTARAAATNRLATPSTAAGYRRGTAYLSVALVNESSWRPSCPATSRIDPSPALKTVIDAG